MQHYPKWIYSASGAKLIESEADHPGDGWYESPADIGTEQPADDVLTGLRALAESKGIKVDKRWGVDRLRAEIAK